jgi:hypothetical protein
MVTPNTHFFLPNVDDNEPAKKKKKRAHGEIVPSATITKISKSEIGSRIRAYLDVLYGSIFCAAGISSSVTRAIPDVVSNILRYNNIYFKRVNLYETSVELFEPIWYDYDIRTGNLNLFFNDLLVTRFCNKRSTLNILSAELYDLRLHKGDPAFLPSTSNILKADDSSVFNCAVLCDHIAQHIIDDLLGSKGGESESIHAHFGNNGITLHSIFNITMMVVKENASTKNENFIIDKFKHSSEQF